jgi:L-asparagine transporter-like permease
LRLRRRIERAEPSRLTIKVWLFPWLSWLTIAAMLGVLVAMAVTPALASQLHASLVTVAIVVAAYAIVRVRRRRGTARAPKDRLSSASP